MKTTISIFAAIALTMSMSPAASQEEEGVTVEGVQIARGESPLPIVGEGAPLYSPEQTASFICENQDMGVFRMFTGPAVQRAHDATLVARQARIDHFQGLTTEEEMIAAELARQDAVRNGLGREGMITAIDGRPERDGLVIEDVAFERVLENGRPIIHVTGRIINEADTIRELPPISLRTADVRGFILASQTVQAEIIEIGPGEVHNFRLRFKNPPYYTAEVRAHFAPPFMTRNFRGCAFFDPLEFDPNESAVRRNVTRRSDAPAVEAPDVGEGAADYTPAELAALYVRARREAEIAFDASNSRICPAATGRHNWRDRLILADRLEEAWSATTAALEVRRDAANGLFFADEVIDAELARQAAVRAAMEIRPREVFITQADYPEIEIRDVRIEDRGGDEVRISGEAVNNGAAERGWPWMRIVVYDRYEMAIIESFDRPERGSVRPGRATRFSFDFVLEHDLARTAHVEFAC